MKTTKKCAFCGRMFTPNSGMQKYCTVHCADEAKKAKKKRQQDLLNAVEPVLEIQRQEYLTFSKAAILMDAHASTFINLWHKAGYGPRVSATVWRSSAEPTSRRCWRTILITG